MKFDTYNLWMYTHRRSEPDFWFGPQGGPGGPQKKKKQESFSHLFAGEILWCLVVLIHKHIPTCEWGLLPCAGHRGPRGPNWALMGRQRKSRYTSVIRERIWMKFDMYNLWMYTHRRSEPDFRFRAHGPPTGAQKKKTKYIFSVICRWDIMKSGGSNSLTYTNMWMGPITPIVRAAGAPGAPLWLLWGTTFQMTPPP